MVITEKEQNLNRWQQHFSVLLNIPSIITSKALDAVLVHPYCNIFDSVPTLDKVSKAVTAMKNSKAPGADGIPAEIFKHSDVKLQRRLHKLFVNIWHSEETLQDFKDASVVTNFKKGDKSDCGNYRGKSLLRIAGKINFHSPFVQYSRQGSARVAVWFQTKKTKKRNGRHDFCCSSATRKVQRTTAELIHSLHRLNQGFWHSQ